MYENADGSPRSSRIEGLPVELLQMVLSALSDVASLHAAVSSCPRFRLIFLEVEATITAQVLSRQIDGSILPEATAAFESSCFPTYGREIQNREGVRDFVARNLRHRLALPRSWSLRSALRLGRLHSCVAWFANKLALAAFSRETLSRSEPLVSPQERSRIECALFRFEIYCNLFRESQDPYSDLRREQKLLFFSKFAPWENEQLGCVHDFLVETVSPGQLLGAFGLLNTRANATSPAFDDIAEHDVAWGAFHVEYGTGGDSPFIQHILSMGLEKLHQIAKSESYEERYDLLYSRYCPNATDSFLCEGLQEANEQNHDVFLEDVTPENESLYIKRPFFADPDSGPADAWRWAHREDSWANWVYQPDRQGLRRWAYVLWDRARLEAVGIFQGTWEDVSQPRDAILEDQEVARQRAYMGNSWEAREQIYMQGGTGWWSWGDRSKVIWRGGVAPRQGPSVPALQEPTSLEDAREFLRSVQLPASIK